MTLLAVPATILPQVRTIGSKTLARRVTIACSASPISHATGTGSTARCGIEACPPRPLTRIVQVSTAASSGPGPADDRAGLEIGKDVQCKGGVGFRIGVEQT